MKAEREPADEVGGGATVPDAAREATGTAAAGACHGDWFHALAGLLAGAAVLSSAVHFWPFHDSMLWQAMCPFNLACVICLAWLAFRAWNAVTRPEGQDTHPPLPHAGILAYVTICLLSAAFSDDLIRAVSFSGKLLLTFVGGYALFCEVIATRKSLQVMRGMATAAVVLAISYSLVQRFTVGPGHFGFFHDSAPKYGTYLGILVPLCGAYLLLGPGWRRPAGAALVAGALLSAGSLGALAAVSASLLALALAVRESTVRFWVLGAITAGLVGCYALNADKAGSLYRDVRLTEADGANLKQRYIEWQAAINILEDRAMMGTGAGCINEQRSKYFFRLPKLNTLAAFDQNGWLTTGAEIGVLGLACLCWAVGHYFKIAWHQGQILRESAGTRAVRLRASNLAGLTGACIAGLFSSVQYNGILIVFVLVLALTAKTDLLVQEDRTW